MLKIKIVQAKPKVGNITFNFNLIKKYYQKALKQKLDICLFPEVITCGYLPQDLLLKSSFIRNLERELINLFPLIGETVLLLPTPLYENNRLFNAVIAVQNGQIIGKTYKKHLPNYGIFDEKRYFAAGSSNLINIKGINIGIPICEDILYPDVCADLKQIGAQILLVPNSSPYEMGKFDRRLAWVEARFAESNLPIIYCNQVAAEDGIIFDGRSFGYDAQGLKLLLPIFTENDVNVAITGNIILCSKPINSQIILEDELYGAMVFGLKEYVHNNGFKSVIIGLSGGIDSALTAAIAVDALGSENVSTIMMPSDFTSAQSIIDAKETADILKIEHQIIPITSLLENSLELLLNLSDVAKQNLQSRIRGMILMAFSNTQNKLLITTGNKSELACGYTTIYGDMCGAFNPIKDLYKSLIYKIANYRNNNIPNTIEILNPYYPVMGKNILIKAPSAELSLDQKDSDDLPEYEFLDQILNLYIEQNLTVKEIVELGFDQQVVEKIIQLIKISEHKRKQSAPGVKLSSCNFEKDRRYPLTNDYKNFY